MLKKLFYINMYDQHSVRLLEENMKRAKKFSLIIIILEALFLIASYVFKDLFPPSLLKYYRLHYYWLLIGGSLMIAITIIYNRIKKYHKVFNVLCYIGFTISLTWGASITLLDLKTSDSMVVYLTFVFMTAFVFLIKPSMSFIILGLTQAAFVIAMTQYPNWYSGSINSTVFVLFAWFVGRYQYYLLAERMSRDILIEEKNEALEKQNLELVRLTMKDHLTGTFNRYSLDEILAKKWTEAYIHRSKISVMMIDIDDFKQFNDTYGHILGDTCLKEVSNLLIGVADYFKGYAFRYGGDEFCMLFSDLQDAELVIKEIKSKVRKIDLAIDEPVNLSIGLYEEVPKTDDAEWHCIDLADQNLYDVKSKRNRRKTD